MTLDLIIRNAVVYDGTGGTAITGDVGVTDGRIVAIGRITDSARETVDAQGLALMPGIVDLHTHYDAQLTWDATMSPSPALGVTTAVMGNCGFGIAPCPAPLRQTMLQNLSVVEGMDLDALRAGTRWAFESFPDYLAMLRAAGPYANVAVFAQHSTIRTTVMGEAASTRAEPTESELAAMRSLVREAIDAGAIGFASSFSPNHSGWGGNPMPSTIATEREIESLVGVLGEARRGVFMMATGPRISPERMGEFAARTGRPMFISTVLTMYNPAHPTRALEYYDRCAAVLNAGREVYIEASCQPLCFDFSLRDPYLLYSHDAFERVKTAGTDELARMYADPTFRNAFRANLANPKTGILFYGDWDRVEVGSVEREAARALEGRGITVIAQERGIDPLDAFFDVALEAGLDTVFVAKLFQAVDDGVEPLLKHRAGVVTLSDAGAHLKFMCDAGFGVHFLAHWVRKRGAFTLAQAAHRLAGDPAAKFRIPERGRIAPGYFADLLLFDPARIALGKMERVADMPGGGTRMIRRASGIHGVWVNGTRVHDGREYVRHDRGPGQVLDRFLQ